MVTAVVNWLGLLVAALCLGGYVAAGVSRTHWQPTLEHYAEAIFFAVTPLAVPLAVASGLVFYGGVKMRRLDSRRLALAAAVLALLVPPAYPIGWPVGLWALATLTAPDVKAAFGRRNREQ